MWWRLLFFSILIGFSIAKDENVLMTEVFEIILNPPLFNWTYEGNPSQFVYQPSLANSPDLPKWINYVFSERHHSGFLYGVPPNRNTKFELEVVALNKRNYETRIENINIHVSEKLNPAKYEVHMKIDNLNVEDIFDVERMDRLKDIFRRQLWPDSENDLYITFLASAIELGARKPLNPNEGDGVVLRLGSQAPFSPYLIELQEEVKPLWKVPSCPRDFKRTSVERYFRNAGFALDWCSFRLIDDSNSALQQSNEKLKSIDHYEDRWEGIRKKDVPQRSYVHEFIFSILLPILVMIVMALILSLILCFHHEGISKRMKEAPQNECEQYATIHNATQSLRSMSNNRDMNLSPDPTLLSRSHTNSPNSTIGHGVHCRPSPPPYVRPKFKPDF